MKKGGRGVATVKGRLPPRLGRCHGCGFHVMPDTEACPHCGGDVPALARWRWLRISLSNAWRFC